MALCWTHISNATVPVIVVVPIHERKRPSPGAVQMGEAGRRKFRPVLRCAEQAFDEGVFIAHTRA